MLVIRPLQIDHFEAQAVESFVAQMASILSAHWPDTERRLGLEGFRVAIRSGISDAQELNICLQSNVAQYLNAMLTLNGGSGFDPFEHPVIDDLRRQSHLDEEARIETLLAYTERAIAENA